jgi:hypothetical protein
VLVATLQSEIAEGQRKLVALAEASGKQRTSSLSKQVNGGLPDGAISLQVDICRFPAQNLSICPLFYPQKRHDSSKSIVNRFEQRDRGGGWFGFG